MSKKAAIKKGDTVEVIAGNDKGATGTVIEVIPSQDRIVVEGVRMQKKHQKPTQENQDGGIVDREGPIHISNVRLAK